MPSTCVCPVLDVSGGALATLTVSVADSLSWNSGEYVPSIPIGDTYDGPTTVTPSTATQVLATNNKVVLSNITVNPIPSNYGLITWNGSVLTVS